MTLPELLDAFASNEPVPGGGSAAALAGCGRHVAPHHGRRFAHNADGHAEEAADLAEASARLRPLRDALTSLVQEDSDAYAAVVAAMRLPKATDADKRARRAAIESAMQRATETPLETMRCCQQALRGAIVVAANGNRNAGSDTAAGVELLLAGLRSAGLNVDINIDSVSDAAFASRVVEERRQLAADADADAHRAREQLGFKRGQPET